MIEDAPHSETAEGAEVDEGLCLHSPLATILKNATPPERSRYDLILKGERIVLWIRKPTRVPIERYALRYSSDVCVKLIADHVDIKRLGESGNEEFVPAFTYEEACQLKEISNTVVAELVKAILSLDEFLVEEGKDFLKSDTWVMFRFQLAKELKMTVRQLDDNMDCDELRLWWSFCELEREYHETQMRQAEADREAAERRVETEKFAKEMAGVGVGG